MHWGADIIDVYAYMNSETLQPQVVTEDDFSMRNSLS